MKSLVETEQEHTGPQDRARQEGGGLHCCRVSTHPAQGRASSHLPGCGARAPCPSPCGEVLWFCRHEGGDVLLPEASPLPSGASCSSDEVPTVSPRPGHRQLAHWSLSGRGLGCLPWGPSWVPVRKGSLSRLSSGTLQNKCPHPALVCASPGVGGSEGWREVMTLEGGGGEGIWSRDKLLPQRLAVVSWGGWPPGTRGPPPSDQSW